MNLCEQLNQHICSPRSFTSNFKNALMGDETLINLIKQILFVHLPSVQIESYVNMALIQRVKTHRHDLDISRAVCCTPNQTPYHMQSIHQSKGNMCIHQNLSKAILATQNHNDKTVVMMNLQECQRNKSRVMEGVHTQGQGGVTRQGHHFLGWIPFIVKYRAGIGMLSVHQ